MGWGPKDDTWELRSRLVEDLGEKTVSCHEIKMRVEEDKKATMKRARDEQSRENNYRKVYTSAPGDSSKRQRASDLRSNRVALLHRLRYDTWVELQLVARKFKCPAVFLWESVRERRRVEQRVYV